jgi:acetoin utilization protein AcuB
VVTVDPRTRITEAAELMARRHIRRLPVVSEPGPAGHLLGILSSSDILHAFPPNVNPFGIAMSDTVRSPVDVAHIMHRDPLSCSPDAPIELAAHLMRERKIGALPVVRDGRLVGVITESDIFRAFVSILAAPHGGVRVTFDRAGLDDPFAFVADLARRNRVKVESLITSSQDDHLVCVVRVSGAGTATFTDELWRGGHRVLNVLPMG